MKKGQTLYWHLNDEQIRAIRANLRLPKRNYPGVLHSLHNLFDAYLELEQQHVELSEKVRTARNALK